MSISPELNSITPVLTSLVSPDIVRNSVSELFTNRLNAILPASSVVSISVADTVI